LLYEGRPVTYVAEQTGRSIGVLSKHYEGVIAQLESVPRVTADEAIRAARNHLVEPEGHDGVETTCSEATERPLLRAFRLKPSAGLEPSTPSLPWRLSQLTTADGCSWFPKKLLHTRRKSVSAGWPSVKSVEVV
jgi:hypothetical protein